jgi:AraC-like DNA-binding protein
MSAKFDDFNDWPSIERSAAWSVAKLAKACRVSERTLRRYVCRHFNKAPGAWLQDKRMERGRNLLLKGWTVKEVAADLQYKYFNHFSRDFKMYYGFCPTDLGRKAVAATQLP